MIQPPMPTVSCCGVGCRQAVKSTALTNACGSVVCHAMACLDSSRRWISAREGSDMRTQVALCAVGTRGMSALLRTCMLPTSVMRACMRSHSPSGCRCTVASGPRASRRCCHCDALASECP